VGWKMNSWEVGRGAGYSGRFFREEEFEWGHKQVAIVGSQVECGLLSQMLCRSDR